MRQADFAYDTGMDAIAFTAGVYSARLSTAADFRDDATTAGFGVVDYDLLAELDETPPPFPADVLLVDCPVQDGATLAALMQLDSRAAAQGLPLVVATTLSALDAVFFCLERSGADIVIEPTRGERVIALARALPKVPRMAVRELDAQDRATLHALTQQVAQIAAQIDRLSAGEPRAFRLESPTDEFRAEEGGEAERKLIRPPRPPLPDPRLVRKIIRQRQLRAEFLDPELFADPAWDILLDLTAARAEHVRVSVTSLCIASGVPPTTALRWISQMTEAGLLVRVEDETDRRRAFIELSDKAADAMARYFHELGKDAKAAL
ncbi:winged helix DNA-binding protein [Tsuneonella sp. YG55]|uniref:Winged helix DNA-binding protein n=1 Tax=Tsuneonella litorea TaxID=2976475 RepID=A0A9X3AKM9_9SPHN|nr:winged helix DNA-binding protein [Tsuneonella litorea]MCT2558604.1 winged helix DNA-binding protein [Tsuneonella litorea]